MFKLEQFYNVKTFLEHTKQNFYTGESGAMQFKLTLPFPLCPVYQTYLLFYPLVYSTLSTV